LRFGHVAITVSNLERTEMFYEHVFGFLRVDKIRDKEFIISMMKKDGITLEFFSAPGSLDLSDYRKDLETDLKTCGVKHFAFSVDDIEKEYNRLKDKGVEFITGIKSLNANTRYFFIKDPDGIFIEIVQDSGQIERRVAA